VGLGGRHQLQAGWVAGVNDAYASTGHLSMEYRYGLSEILSVGIGGLYRITDRTTAAYDLLQQPIDLVQVRTTTPWSTHLAVRASPAYGKVAFGNRFLAHYGLHADLGVGLAGVRVEVPGSPPDDQRSFAGWGEVGLQIFLRRWISFELLCGTTVWQPDIEAEGTPIGEKDPIKWSAVAGFRVGVLLP